MPSFRIPHEIRWASDIAGEEAALRLVERFGGTRVYIPHAVTEASPLAAIGIEEARAIGRELGGQRVNIPLAKRWRAQKMRQAGHSYVEIARTLNVTEAMVWRYLDLAGQTNQLQLSL